MRRVIESINLVALMKKTRIIIVCIPLIISCSTGSLKDGVHPHARIQYVDFLNEYWCSGDVSMIDSALIYNAYMLESDSANIHDYLYRIQMLDLSSQHDSIFSVVDRIPHNMISCLPEYKSYLRLKCRAVMARNAGDTVCYRSCLDSILLVWEPVLSDSIAKADSLFSRPMDSIPNHLWFLYESYYEIVAHRHGKDSVGRILSAKKDRFNWDNETYRWISLCANGDGELTLP